MVKKVESRPEVVLKGAAEYDETDDKFNFRTSVENLPGSFLTGIEFDYIAVTYPDTVTEVFTYKNGGGGGTTVATITVTYQTESKENLVSVEKS